ncbi:hypothetical protein FRB94_008556 [Tulasnella sp. JGI-2019a]|nr:hypothetical protein FRB94_008556 [Tulasnella sp. JGI-2019a]KAG9010627.1 hypothetical protein FRB93_003895 [Tulasnella sp. JGI-2019a]KAG9027025.1 hypothetical protein FRB95_008190 [Tulasnella sp. JGI-2019a]
MSLLPTGTYIIESKTNRQAIGTRPGEETTIVGKPIPVVSLPQGVEAPKWEIEKNQKGDTYVLTIGGGTVAEIDNLVATLPELGIGEWRVTTIPQTGPDTYIIETVDGGRGWVLSEEEPFTQVAVRPLIVGRSDPPFYSPNQLFVIRRNVYE